MAHETRKLAGSPPKGQIQHAKVWTSISALRRQNSHHLRLGSAGRNPFLLRSTFCTAVQVILVETGGCCLTMLITVIFNRDITISEFNRDITISEALRCKLPS